MEREENYYRRFYNEDYEDYEDYEDEEEEKEMLQGVAVRDTEKGLEVTLMGAESGVLEQYEIQMNIKGYDQKDLFKICYEISKKINSKYYEVDILTKQDIIEIARKEFIK